MSDLIPPYCNQPIEHGTLFNIKEQVRGPGRMFLSQLFILGTIDNFYLMEFLLEVFQNQLHLLRSKEEFYIMR